MHSSNLIIEEHPDPRDLDFVSDQIDAFNIAVTGINDWRASDLRARRR
jgi:hypothetical protein